MSTDTVLKVQGVSKRFGGLQALSDVGITIQRGSAPIAAMSERLTATMR